MAAPAVGSVGTYLTGGFGTSAAVPVPASVASGDVILAFIYTEALGTVTPPAGFTVKSAILQSNHQLVVAWKRATGADTGTYSFTWSGSEWREASAIRFTGVIGSGDPFNGTVGTGTNSSTSTPAVSTSTSLADTLIVWAATNFNGGAWTPPSGYTERTDAGGDLTVATVVQTAAGSTGSITGTAASSAANCAFIGALAPSSAAYTRTVDDPLGLTDSLVRDDGEGIAEITGLTDGTAAVDFGAARSDDVGVTDAVDASLSFGHSQTPTDSTGLTDNLFYIHDTGSPTFSRSPVDPLGLSHPTPVVDFAGTRAETTGLTDTASVIHEVPPTTARTQTDGVGLADSGSVIYDVDEQTQDNVSLSDGPQLWTWSGERLNFMRLRDTVTVQLLQAKTVSRTDLLGITDLVAVDKTATLSHTFSPPTVKEKYGRHRLFSRIPVDVGVTVLRTSGNNFRQIRDPEPELLTAALEVYIGGHTYTITQEAADRLILAGYGAYVGGPGGGAPSDTSGYGTGAFGTGEYGV